MQLPAPPPDVAHAGLRALKTVAMADGTFADLERGLLDSVQRLVLHTDVDVDALEPITPDELAGAIPAGEFRERILRGCTLMALVDGEASAAEEALLVQIARALDVDVAPVTDFRRIAHGRFTLLRLDIVRRSFIGKRLKQHVDQYGVRGLVQAARSFKGTEVPEVATRYRALDSYADGTLGREYARFMRANEFALPGEAHGAPEPIVFHDCVHVLGGYRTTPEEEVLAAAYQAGFQKYDPFFSLLFVLCQFHLGIQISPIAGTTSMMMKPDTMLAAFLRGTECSVDLSDGWDPWDHFGEPVDALRAAYNVVPRD